MQKVLIVNDLIKGGGVEKLLQDFVNRWHDKYDVTVMSTYKEHDFYEYYPANVKYLFKTVYNRYTRKCSIAFVKCMIKKIICRLRLNYIKKHNDFDVIIALKDGEITKLMADFKAPRKYTWYHTDYSSYYYSQYLYGTAEYEFKILKKYTNVVCVSEIIKESLIKVLGDTGNYVVKYNPLNNEKIDYDGNEPVLDYKKTEGKTLFVVVGRINYQKGYDLLLEAAHMLEQDGYNFEVLVIGGREDWSDEYDRIMRSMNRLNIQTVKFIGLRSNPYKYMKMADWMLSTSIFEGYSLVSQEAALLDTPMLLTDCSGVRELLGDSEYGIVMEPSVRGIYEGMKRVMDDPELREHYKQKIIERKAIIDQDERFRSIEELVFGDDRQIGV
jgi:glycosyltransferase involved in cell wall biosynthesis